MIIYGGEKSLQLQLMEETEIIKGKVEIQEKNKNICNVYMEKISDYINNVDPSSVRNQIQFENTLMSLKEICDNVILDLQDLNDLKKGLEYINSLPNEKTKEIIEEYNNTYVQIMQRIDRHDIQMQDFTETVLQNYAFVLSESNKTLTEDSPVIKTNREVLNSLDTNILVVSEKDQVAYLPYKMEEVEKYLKSRRKNKHRYSSVQEVIDNEYIVPLTLFRFPTIARFREVFNLVRKENGLLEAFETAVELMTNFSLDPIVVRSCRNVQELNIFVDCLEEEETEKFPCFEIKYEFAPTITRRKKNEEFFTNN